MDVDFFAIANTHCPDVLYFLFYHLKFLYGKNPPCHFFSGVVAWFGLLFLLVCVQEVQSMYNIFILSFFSPFHSAEKMNKEKKGEHFYSSSSLSSSACHASLFSHLTTSQTSIVCVCLCAVHENSCMHLLPCYKIPSCHTSRL